MITVELWGTKMEGVHLQYGLAAIMFVATAVAGLLPLKVLSCMAKKEGESRRASWILTLLSCFAGGVFLATCFLDIIPHVSEKYSSHRKTYNWKYAYPLPEFMACIGFFFVYFVEELSLKVFAGADHHGHSHGNGKQTHSLGPTSISVDEPLKLQTSLNGSSVLHPHGVTDESVAVLERKNSRELRYSVINTHEVVMDESVRYVSSEVGEGGFLKSLTFAFAMSFHSILEGFALGVQDDQKGIVNLFLSLIIHKGIEAFSVGLQISRSNTRRLYLVLATIVVYALMTPVGSILGVLLAHADMNVESRDLIIILLEGCAAGTFIYVTFFEVLAQERANDHSNLVQLAAIVIGFFSIAALQARESFSESDEHGGHAHG
ncbi:hypothetical protein M3Y99_01992900 [Aphelenchoides fujianensis]|nr:hypothetical protein M3Y99_01992900 [Aphelenchoides fujianensis]